MILFRAFVAAALPAAALCLLPAASAATASIIMQGLVTMADGSPPPKPVGIQRLCSDNASAPGPLTDKGGRFLWRMELDPMAQRACWIEATFQGFTSSKFEMSTIDLHTLSGANVLTLPNLVLSPHDSGELNSIILINESEVPGKALPAWKAAVTSLKADNIPEATTHFQEAVQAVPKFADGWNILGALYERQHTFDKAREALQKALELNPKLLSPYMRLARICDETSDYDGAVKAAEALLKVDKRYYPEIYLHLSIARIGLKDMVGAESSANTAIGLDAPGKVPRAEYVLGRILQAKGDMDGAREHIAKYLKMDPNVQDSSQIKILLEYLGKPDAPKLETSLERPY